MKDIEIWAAIEGFPDHMVSNKGRVKNINRTYTRKDGVTIFLKERIKKQCKSRGHFVTRIKHDEISKCFYVHRLIALSFIPNPENKPFINHIDGNKSNNSISNLEWCTSSENNQHAIDTGLRSYKKGVSHRLSIFSQEQVINIRHLYNSGNKIANITRLYNVSRGAIQNVAKGNSYK